MFRETYNSINIQKKKKKENRTKIDEKQRMRKCRYLLYISLELLRSFIIIMAHLMIS